MSAEQLLAYKVKRQFNLNQYKNWILYLCEKRTVEQVEEGVAGLMSTIHELRILDEKIQEETMPEYDNPLN